MIDIDRLRTCLDDATEAEPWLRSLLVANLPAAHLNFMRMAEHGVTLDLLSQISEQFAAAAPTLTAQVNSNAQSPVTNVATVSGGGDATPPNNTDGDTAPIGSVALPVPAGSAWTLMLLAAALLLFARRRLAPVRR